MENVGIFLLTFGMFNGRFADSVVTWYLFPCFGILYQGKSDKPWWG
jgi:hypothetical protein